MKDLTTFIEESIEVNEVFRINKDTKLKRFVIKDLNSKSRFNEDELTTIYEIFNDLVDLKMTNQGNIQMTLNGKKNNQDTDGFWSLNVNSAKPTIKEFVTRWYRNKNSTPARLYFSTDLEEVCTRLHNTIEKYIKRHNL